MTFFKFVTHEKLVFDDGEGVVAVRALAVDVFGEVLGTGLAHHARGSGDCTTHRSAEADVVLRGLVVHSSSGSNLPLVLTHEHFRSELAIHI